jgi:hypothetical protein
LSPSPSAVPQRAGPRKRRATTLVEPTSHASRGVSLSTFVFRYIRTLVMFCFHCFAIAWVGVSSVCRVSCTACVPPVGAVRIGLGSVRSRQTSTSDSRRCVRYCVPALVSRIYGTRRVGVMIHGLLRACRAPLEGERWKMDGDALLSTSTDPSTRGTTCAPRHHLARIGSAPPRRAASAPQDLPARHSL